MSLPDALRSRLGPDVLSFDPAELETYGRDWTRVYTPAPLALARPRTAAEVSETLAVCNQLDVAVVPSGGRTGLAGGAVARAGELLLSLERLRGMGQIDRVGNTVRVEAGAVTAAVHDHVAEADLLWPIDFASKGSSTVGGNIATNAGGVRVIRYGLTRAWVLGLEVALMSGQTLALNGALEKNNTGIDLRQLFIGSEGILGVITAATLKLTGKPRRVGVSLFAVENLNRVVDLFRMAQHSGLVLSAFEFFTDACLARLLRHRRLRPPFSQSASHYVLVEAEARDDREFSEWCARVVDDGIASDGTIAQSAGQARELWTLREGISESLAATGMPHKNDIALPVAALEAFCRELDRVFAARYPGWEICNFGHIGDGNLHINVMKPDGLSPGEFLAQTHEADRDLFELVSAHRGSISAEHGIGLLKRDALHFSRTGEEIEAMRQIKRVFDPKGLLNPGKVFALG